LKPLAPSPAWTLVTPYCKRTRPGRGTNTKVAGFPPLSRRSPAASLSPLRARPRARPIWTGARGDIHSSAQGPPGLETPTPLFVRGHIDGIPIAKMLVDGGATVNLMPYSLYRKLGKQDDELVKTNMTLSGVGTDSSIKARGVTSVELTIGTKTLAAAFFVADVEGNYSLILGRDWIHVNQCIPSTLHQMLIQWVDDDIEQVHADVSACIAVADAPILWTYETATCLTGVDFSDYQFISIDKKGFIPVMLEPMENRLNPK
jgi:hypothetical protein